MINYKSLRASLFAPVFCIIFWSGCTNNANYVGVTRWKTIDHFGSENEWRLVQREEYLPGSEEGLTNADWEEKRQTSLVGIELFLLHMDVDTIPLKVSPIGESHGLDFSLELYDSIKTRIEKWDYAKPSNSALVIGVETWFTREGNSKIVQDDKYVWVVDIDSKITIFYSNYYSLSQISQSNQTKTNVYYDHDLYFQNDTILKVSKMDVDPFVRRFIRVNGKFQKDTSFKKRIRPKIGKWQL